MPAPPPSAATVAAPRVVGLGLTVVDRQMILPRLPGPDEKATATAARVQVGGPVPTALAQLAKLGGPLGGLISAWGDDPDGAAIERDLGRTGLRFDASQCRCVPQTATAQVWVEAGTGRRSLVALRPDGRELTAEYAAGAAAGADLLHTDGWPGAAAVAACRAVRAGGGTVSVDLGASRKTSELPGLADVLNLPAQALPRLTESRDPVEAARRLCERGPRLVTITNGSRGCWFASRSGDGFESGFLPAFPATAVDTNGAGDAFCGGLLFAVLHDYPAARAVRFASAVASLKVRSLGNRDALPDRAAVEALLASDAAPDEERAAHEKTPADP